MSHLTSDTREVWVAIFYDAQDAVLHEGCESNREEDAINEAHETVALFASKGEYHYAKIEHRIVPIYK